MLLHMYANYLGKKIYIFVFIHLSMSIVSCLITEETDRHN